MTRPSDPARAEALYRKVHAIRDGEANGHWLPILRLLARRGHTEAMIDLADWLSDSATARGFGAPSDPSSAAGLYRRAYRKGDPRAASNLAMSCFNRDDLGGYRRWLARAARAGDADAARQLRRFETRLPHSDARRIGRHRPEAKRDAFA